LEIAQIVEAAHAACSLGRAGMIAALAPLLSAGTIKLQATGVRVPCPVSPGPAPIISWIKEAPGGQWAIARVQTGPGGMVGMTHFDSFALLDFRKEGGRWKLDLEEEAVQLSGVGKPPAKEKPLKDRAPALWTKLRHANPAPAERLVENELASAPALASYMREQLELQLQNKVRLPDGRGGFLERWDGIGSVKCWLMNEPARAAWRVWRTDVRNGPPATDGRVGDESLLYGADPASPYSGSPYMIFRKGAALVEIQVFAGGGGLEGLLTLSRELAARL
jgi:hypothetical protein